MKSIWTILCCGTLLFNASAVEKRPNVILIITDDQGYGDLSCHGNPVLETPNLDKLHEQSVRLTNFHVDPTCAPTRGALLSGKYSHRARIWHTIAGGNCMRASEVTMADAFKEAGYRTGCFGKWHLGASYPFRPMDRGFEEWVGHGDGGTGTTADWFTNDRVNDHYIHNGEWKQIDGWAPEVFFDQTIRFATSSDKPFFAYLATYLPHSPHTIPDTQWLDKFEGRCTSREATYFACIEGIDRLYGKLDRALDEAGIADNTIVIFMTDNGGTAGVKLFNAGMRGNKGSVHDGGHRVPFFFRWPAGGIKAGCDVETLNAHIDVFPTLGEICGLKVDPAWKLDGRSFKDQLFNPDAVVPDRSLMVERQRTLEPIKDKSFAVMTQRWRYLQEGKGGPVLYDMNLDPGQQKDLAKQHPEVVQALQADYETYWKHVSPGDRDVARPVIGTPYEAVTLLHAADMYIDGTPWNHAKVAAGPQKIAPYAIKVAEDGTYRIEVRRWPKEAKAPMAGVPVIEKTVDSWAGTRPVPGLIYNDKMKALPVVSVHLKVGDFEASKKVSADDTCTVFEASLKKGDAFLQADLMDKDGGILTSAYYVYVSKL